MWLYPLIHKAGTLPSRFFVRWPVKRGEQPRYGFEKFSQDGRCGAFLRRKTTEPESPPITPQQSLKGNRVERARPRARGQQEEGNRIAVMKPGARGSLSPLRQAKWLCR